MITIPPETMIGEGPRWALVLGGGSLLVLFTLIDYRRLEAPCLSVHAGPPWPPRADVPERKKATFNLHSAVADAA